jgi:choice-of-anchor A domain-containing protein
MRFKDVAARVVLAGLVTMAFARPAASQSLGAANSFAVLSSGDVTFKNRVNVSQVSVSGAPMCPGAVGCPGDVGGVTVLMGRGNASSPDTVSGDVIGSANSSTGLNCAKNAPGTTAICLGNDSEVAGVCATGGGAIDSPTECGLGSDTTGSNSDVTTLLPQADSAIVSFSASLAALPATHTLPEIALGTRGTTTITTTTGLSVISIPAITTGTNSTITITAGPTDTVVINVGSSSAPGSLQLGNGASVVLSGGITPDRVIFNLVGASTTAQLGNQTVFNGSIVAPQGQFTSGDGNTPNPVQINGALLFGGSVSIGNNTNLNFYPFVGVSTTGGGGTSSSTTSS